MLRSATNRFLPLLVHPDPKRQRRAIVALLLAGGLGIGLLVGIAGPTIAVALAVAGLGAWLVLRSPLWGLLGIIGVSTLLPFATLPFKIGFTPSFLDLAIFATFGVWALKYALAKETRFTSSAIGGSILLFLIMAAFTFAIGLQYSRPTSNNIRQFGEMVLSITLFFVVINAVRQRRHLLFLVRSLMLGGAGAALIGIVFYVIPPEATVWILDHLTRLGYPGGFGALRFVNDDPAGLMRAIGTSIDPNVFGGLLILVGVITLPQLFSKRPLFNRRWVVIMLALDTLALYLTISRGSMLGFAVGLIVIGALRYRKLLLLGFVAAAIFFILPFTQNYVHHLVAGLAGQDRATQMRFGEYKDALTLISRYPVFGVGFTGVPEIDLYIGVSSLYLLIAEEMGLVGLGIFLITMVAFINALLTGLRLPLRDAEYDPILLGILGAMAGLLTGGIFDHYLFNLTYPHMTALLWVVVGMGMKTVALAQENVASTAET
ncbi:MAG: O-antigen ligase family protein [Chloroflexi bacterium]|nr:O-antigen ligase family protein [Chloroflexota bacterium]